MRFKLSHDVKQNSFGCYPRMSDDDVLAAAEKSALYTHPLANRRYGNLLFNVRDLVIVSVFEEQLVLTKKVDVVCSDCENDGGYCNTCNSTGFVKVTVREATEDQIKEDRRVRHCRKIQGAEKLSASALR